MILLGYLSAYFLNYIISMDIMIVSMENEYLSY